MTSDPKTSDALTRGFIDRVLAVVAIGIVLAALWVIADLILLIFGAILVAVILRRIALPLISIGGLSERWAVTAAMLIVIAVVVTTIGLFGAELANQLRALSGQLVDVGRRLAAQLEISSISDLVGSDST